MKKISILFLLLMIFCQCSKTTDEIFPIPPKPIKQLITAHGWEFTEVSHDDEDFSFLYTDHFFIFSPEGKFAWARILTCGMVATFRDYRIEGDNKTLILTGMNNVDLPGPIGENHNYSELEIRKINDTELVLFTITDEGKETWLKLKKSDMEFIWQ